MRKQQPLKNPVIETIYEDTFFVTEHDLLSPATEKWGALEVFFELSAYSFNSDSNPKHCFVFILQV